MWNVEDGAERATRRQVRHVHRPKTRRPRQQQSLVRPPEPASGLERRLLQSRRSAGAEDRAHR